MLASDTLRSRTPPSSAVRPRPSTGAHRLGTLPCPHAASPPPAGEHAAGLATALTCTYPNRTPLPPTSSAPAAPRTRGSTAVPHRQSPWPPASRPSGRTTRDLKHSLRTFDEMRSCATAGDTAAAQCAQDRISAHCAHASSRGALRRTDHCALRPTSSRVARRRGLPRALPRWIPAIAPARTRSLHGRWPPRCAPAQRTHRATGPAHHRRRTHR